MEGRHRTRRFLSGEEADRPPFVPLATSLTARLAQVDEDALFSDPHVLTESFIQAAAVCRFEHVLLRPPRNAVADAVRGPYPASQDTLGVVREVITRLRALLQDRVAIGLLLPGPSWLARTLERDPTPTELEGVAGKLLQVAQSLDPPSLDLLGILEEDPLGPEAVGDVVSSLSSFWNSARYFAIPSLFVAADAGPTAGKGGATATARWRGATVEELLAAGTPRVGVPVDVRSFPPLPPLPAGGFWITEGEIPSDVAVQEMQQIAAVVEAEG
jgi:hypothetical protein